MSVIFYMPLRFRLREEFDVKNTNPWRKREIIFLKIVVESYAYRSD